MRIMGTALLVSVLAATGCTSGFGFLGFGAPPPVKKDTTAPKPPPGPVTADQVNPSNAHKVAEALQQEMDRE